MTTDTTTVRMEHCRAAGFCAKGVRALAARYNLDYPKFLSDGIDAEELLKVTGDDAMVKAAVEIARG